MNRVKTLANHRYAPLIGMVLLLLLAAALRIRHFMELPTWYDEIWSVWQVQGSLQATLVRNSPDWPPLFGVLLWGWQQLTGPMLEASRTLMTLCAMLFLALLYRAALALVDLIDHPPAVTQRRKLAGLAALVGTVIAYGVFAGIDVRAYGLLLMLGALACWLTIRWLRRPSWRRAAGVAVTFALLMYTSFTSAVFIAYLTLVVLVMRPRLLGRWIVIGAATLGLSLPVMPQFFSYGPLRVGARMIIPLPPFGEAMALIFRDFGGADGFVLLVMIAAITLLVVLWRSRAERRLVGLLIAWNLFPVVVYFGIGSAEFMKPRYMWWMTIGLILLTAYGISRLPGRLWWIGLAVLVALPFTPIDFDRYRLSPTDSPPLRATFAWLAERLRPDDVLVIDPLCTCGYDFGWDYYVPLYFPSGRLPIVDHPGDASRVWYLSTRGWGTDEALEAAVNEGRVPSDFHGPWFFLLRLYEGPPSWAGISFGERVRFHGYELIEDDVFVYAEDETITVKLWWAAEVPLERDYSISLALFDGEGRLIAQADGPAQAPDTPQQTSAWEPGTIYQDTRTLHIPPGQPEGTYRLALTVYQWWDGARLPVADRAEWTPLADPEGYLLLQTIHIMND